MMLANISRRRLLWALTLAPLGHSGLSAAPPTEDSLIRIATSQTPIPNEAIRLHTRHGNENVRVVVTAIAIDPIGRQLAVAGDDHVIRILDASTLELKTRLNQHRDLIRSLAFDATGNQLASVGNDGQVIVWNAKNNYAIARHASGTPALVCVCFSPDRAELRAVGFDKEVYTLAGSDRMSPTFECSCRDLRSITYRDDNRLMAVAGRSGDLHLFDPANGRLNADHHLHDGRIRDIKFHRGSNIAVTVGEDGHVTVFDTARMQTQRRIKVTTGKLFCVAVLDHERVAVAGSDNLIRVVNTASGEIELQLKGHEGSIAALAVGNDSLYSGGYDAMLRSWKINSLTGTGQRFAGGEKSIER